MEDNRKKVLIICTGNSCRSQMAEAIINHDLSNRWLAYSAGTNPSKLNPWAIQVMSEIGIDISGQRSKSVKEFLNRNDLDLVITVCDNARETCPIFPAKVKHLHIGFEDPAPFSDNPPEIALPVFRKIRDKIREKLNFVLENFDL
ncbi:arsenate reductase ArsC [bacterium]|nr:arsenate reductase ArsC [bacterium]